MRFRQKVLTMVEVEAWEEGGIKPTEAGSIVLVTQCVGKKFGSGRWEGVQQATPGHDLGRKSDFITAPQILPPSLHCHICPHSNMA